MFTVFFCVCVAATYWPPINNNLSHLNPTNHSVFIAINPYQSWPCQIHISSWASIKFSSHMVNVSWSRRITSSWQLLMRQPTSDNTNGWKGNPGQVSLEFTLMVAWLILVTQLTCLLVKACRSQKPMIVLMMMRAFSAGAFMLGCNQPRLHKIYPLAKTTGKTRTDL